MVTALAPQFKLGPYRVDRSHAQILVLNLEDPASVNYLKSHRASLANPEIRARVLVGNLPSGKQVHLVQY